jgi:Spy/CpxP family protein refolding chaperone
MKCPTFFLAALAMTSLALADQAASPSSRPLRGPGIERLAQDLGLDETQQAQVKQILEAQHAKMESERAQLEASGTHPSREEMQAKHEQADAELDQQLATVLTPEQLAKFAEIRKQHHRGPPPGEGPREDPGQ